MWCWKKKAATLALVAAILAILVPLSSPAYADPIVSPDGWEWQNPLPQGNPLFGIWGSSSSDVHAVGEGGTILHYDGSTWSGMSSGTTTGELMSVWGSSSSNVFAVGGYSWWDGITSHSASTILHYDGSSWSEMGSGAPLTLSSIWGSSSSDIYAVGGYWWWSSSGGEYETHSESVILHYDGSSWSPVLADSGYALQAVWGSSSNDIFAVGGWGDPTGTYYIILHYDGTNWSQMGNGTGYTLRAVWGSSSNDVFAVGDWSNPDGNYYIILHYDGISWSQMDSGTGYGLRGIWGISSSDVFAVGTSGTYPNQWGLILHYDGSSWTEMDSCAERGLECVWGSSASKNPKGRVPRALPVGE